MQLGYKYEKSQNRQEAGRNYENKRTPAPHGYWQRPITHKDFAKVLENKQYTDYVDRPKYRREDGYDIDMDKKYDMFGIPISTSKYNYPEPRPAWNEKLYEPLF